MTDEATNPVVDEDVSDVLASEGVDQEAQAEEIDATEATEESEAEEGEDQPAEEDDHEEIEWEDGQKYRVPKALKPALLRQADYTRKTQEAAEDKRQAAARIAEWQEADENLVDARATLKTIDNRLKQIEGLTDEQWARMQTENPVQANALSREERRLRDQRAQVEGAVTDYTSRMTAAQERERANLRTEMFSEVARKVPDWSDQLGDEVAGFAIQEFGIEPEALRNLTDPKALLVLHRAFLGDKALKAQQKSQKHTQAQKTKPVPTLNRGAGGRIAPKGDTDDFAAFERAYGDKLGA